MEVVSSKTRLDMTELEDYKETVLDKLAQLNADELTEICTGITMEIPESKKGKKTTLYRALTKRLMDDTVEGQEDHGEALFQLVDTSVDRLLDLRPVPIAVTEDVQAEYSGNGQNGDGEVHPEVKVETTMGTEVGISAPTNTSAVNGTLVSQMMTGATAMAARLGAQTNTVNSSRSALPVNRQMTVHKIREFKINGGYVGGDEVGGVEYISLSYQIDDGLSKGYSEAEIQGGVVRSMRAGYPLRKVFETKARLPMKVFLKYLRSDYKVKDSGTLWTELLNAVQEPKESTMGFFWRVVGVKDLVLIVSREEGVPMDAEMVQKRAHHALRVGLNNTAIRLEFQPILNSGLEEHDLSTKLSEIVAREEEHQKKVKPAYSGKKVDVNSMEADMCYLQDKPSKEDMILAEIREMKGTVNELSTIKGEVEGLAKRMNAYDEKLEKLEKAGAGTGAGGGNNRNKSGFKFQKCENCERERKFCNHCNKCGQEGHKRKDCTEN